MCEPIVQGNISGASKRLMGDEVYSCVAAVLGKGPLMVWEQVISLVTTYLVLLPPWDLFDALVRTNGRDVIS